MTTRDQLLKLWMWFFFFFTKIEYKRAYYVSECSVAPVAAELETRTISRLPLASNIRDCFNTIYTEVFSFNYGVFLKQ